jgi:triosephosphate isomerase
MAGTRRVPAIFLIFLVLQSHSMKKSVPLIVGNWKCNPQTRTEAATLAHVVARRVKQSEEPYVAVVPPYPFLESVGKKIAKSAVKLGAQDVGIEPLGPFTGEVSAAQLKDAGADFVIIGHSERRAMGETDAQVAAKTQQALKHRLLPIVCVGERARDEYGDFFTIVQDQLRSLAADLTAAQIKQVVIAYEPIWAIGTGKTATPDDVKEMQLYIETVLTRLFDRATARNVRLLYGGSVKPHNAAALHATGDMHGFLVGGASLRGEDFIEIVKAVSA